MLIKNFYKIIRASFVQFAWLSILISFLLFFLNILFWLSVYTQSWSQEVKDKLWMYFYFTDDADTDWQIYARIIELKWKLEKEWVRTRYYWKQEWLQRLSERIPDITESLLKHQIDNPLPPTLYVMFDNEKQYSVIQNHVIEAKDIIMNWEEASKWYTFKDQENRIQNVINLSNFLVIFSYFLIWVLLIIILSFIILILHIVFNNYQKQIEIEKLLWADLLSIKMPFLFFVVVVLFLAFIFMGLYLNIFLTVLNQYTLKLYSFDVFISLNKLVWNMFLWTFVEFIVISIVGIFIWNIYLNRLLKKVWNN